MAKLKEKTIIEQWSVLIEGANGKGKEVFKMTEKILQEKETPKIKLIQKMVAPSFFKQIQGKEKPFLVVSNTYLKGYKMYIGATDYGQQLFVSWYLSLEPNKYLKIIQALPWWAQLILLPIQILIMIWLWLRRKSKAVSPEFLDIFDMEELSAYVTTVHHALIDTTEAISKEVDFDFTKVDLKSRGFLNIS